MAKVWEKSKIDIYFDDLEQEKLVRQGFNNLVDGTSEEDIASFVQTMNSLHELPAAHAIVSESYRYAV